MACEIVTIPGGGTVMMCGRSLNGRGSCNGLGKPAIRERDPDWWRCPGCGNPAKVYETADGKWIVYDHVRNP